MERWKKIENFPDYAVSSLGRVKRLTYGRGTNAKGGILKPNVSKKGYLRVFLSKESKKHTKVLHIIVAKAFLANPRHLPQVNHKDTNKKNCKVSNLEWRSNLGNMQHAAKKGLVGNGGVYFHKGNGKWVATYNPTSRNRVYLGGFSTKFEAQIARAAALKEMKESM